METAACSDSYGSRSDVAVAATASVVSLVAGTGGGSSSHDLVLMVREVSVATSRGRVKQGPQANEGLNVRMCKTM